jgi:hypothetical protein
MMASNSQIAKTIEIVHDRALSREERMDMYTKAVLTVIAVSLAAIALQNSGLLPAHAAGLASPQAVCGYDLSGRNLDCARVVNGALVVSVQ